MKLAESRIAQTYADPAYRRYAPGSHISAVGTWMQRIAQAWLVLSATGGSAAALGLITAVQLLPTLILGPLGGHLADRLPRRGALIVLQACSLLLATGLAIAAMGGHATLPVIYLVSALTGVIAGLEGPLRSAFLHDLAGTDQIAAVVALESASGNVAKLAGPALAGALIAVAGVGPVIALNAISYLAVIASLVALRGHVTHHNASRTQQATGSWAGVARVLRRRTDLIVVLGCVTTVGLFAINVTLVVPVMATTVFGRSSAGYGLLTALAAVGSVAGAVLAARRRAASLRVVVGGTITLGLVFVLSAIAPSYPTYAATLVAIGWCSTTMNTAASSYLQLSVPNAVRGRILALQMMAFAGAGAISCPLLGMLADAIGVRPTSALIGAATVAGAVVVASGYLASRGLVIRPRTSQHTTLPRLVVLPRASVTGELAAA